MIVILALGNLIQTSAGFGFGLFTIPLLVTLGCEPFQAIVLAAIGSAAQASLGLVALRRHVRWGRVLVMAVIASAAVPFGVLLLGMLAQHHAIMVQRLFGALVLMALVMMVAIGVMRVKPRRRLPPSTMVGAMLASGFMGGFSGMSGPPAVVWVIAHKWSNQEVRTTLWGLFGAMVPIQLIALRYRFGAPVDDAVLLGLALVPTALIGMLPGLWIGQRIPRRWLRRIAMVILTVVALTALLAP